ncbi:MAG: cyclic pyranopterin monophosphate synthase MoaC [Erysipelotrichaceae bacterium]|nr:cyclic pyranopterin monophosphate synthase MoaC [Erysipelotrichaceae bacterium]MDY5251162.1 cyclic pyranopterin monophosphate synthase MoaC [Erysipelotrichaceae bacterium]
MNEFTHFNEQGEAIMVDVSEKNATKRQAIAKGSIYVCEEILNKIKNKDIAKGDVLGVARIAGIMGVKRTSELIPLCHPLPISKVSIDFEIVDDHIDCYCTVKVDHKTGVEMEALCGVNIALLTIYDMCKAVDKRMVINNVHLVEKTGGKSGHFTFEKGYDNA